MNKQGKERVLMGEERLKIRASLRSWRQTGF